MRVKIKLTPGTRVVHKMTGRQGTVLEAVESARAGHHRYLVAFDAFEGDPPVRMTAMDVNLVVTS